MFKKLFLIVLLFALLPFGVPTQAQDDSDPFSLTIMHTNDTHAHHDPNRDGEGGVAKQATVVNEIRAEVPNTLLLDGGDRFTGSIFHSFHKGWDNAQVMNLLGYDAMVLGSYEFTHGAQTLADFINLLDFPVVVANVDFSQSAGLDELVVPYAIHDFDDSSVGIIGVTEADARLRPIPELGFRTDFADAVQENVDLLTAQGINKIVLISHLGYFDDLELANQVSGVDVIVGGDTNTVLSNTIEDAEGPYPAVTENLDGEPVLVVQAGSFNEYLGRLDVTFDAEGVLTDWSGDVIFLSADIEAEAEMTALVEQLRAPIGDFLNEKVGESLVYLEGAEEVCRFVECSMGNLITDAMRDGTGAQIAFQNGGGIRASIAEGDILVSNVLDVLPFNNTYVIFELSGEDVIAALENGLTNVFETEGTGRFLQVSGLRYSWDGTQEVGRRVVSVEVLNEDGEYEELDPDDVYSVVTNDYLFAGGDDYRMFAENSEDSYDFGRTLDELVRFYIGNHSPIDTTTEQRIVRVDQ